MCSAVRAADAVPACCCCPPGNAIKHLKLHISKIDPSTPEEVAKEELLDTINSYVVEKVGVQGWQPGPAGCSVQLHAVSAATAHTLH
jgi:hypothetical protein